MKNGRGNPRLRLGVSRRCTSSANLLPLPCFSSATWEKSSIAVLPVIILFYFLPFSFSSVHVRVISASMLDLSRTLSLIGTLSRSLRSISLSRSLSCSLSLSQRNSLSPELSLSLSLALSLDFSLSFSLSPKREREEWGKEVRRGKRRKKGRRRKRGRFLFLSLSHRRRGCHEDPTNFGGLTWTRRISSWDRSRTEKEGWDRWGKLKRLG